MRNIFIHQNSFTRKEFLNSKMLHILTQLYPIESQRGNVLFFFFLSVRYLISGVHVLFCFLKTGCFLATLSLQFRGTASM